MLLLPSSLNLERSVDMRALRRAASASRSFALLRQQRRLAASDHSSSSVQYPFQEIEARWQRYWEQHGTFRTPDAVDTSKPKFYALDMFPYPRRALRHLPPPAADARLQRRGATRRPPGGLHGD
jgi:hypothetical protein